jgi:hypothetical protein
MKHADPEAQRDDLLRLLSLVEDPRAMAEDLKRTERGWLRAAEGRLRLDDAGTGDATVLRAARLTHRLLRR